MTLRSMISSAALALVASSAAISGDSVPVDVCQSNPDPRPSVPYECFCKSKGGQDGEVVSGGDGYPIKWSSAVYEIKEATQNSPPENCFDISVRNNANADVWDVWWRDANYLRHKISKHCLRANCSYINDHVSEEPVSGPLHYGVGNDPYQANTYVPKGGWTQDYATGIDLESGDYVPPVLQTRMDVEVPDSDGNFALSTLEVETVYNTEDKAIQYKFSQKGKNPLWLHFNVVKDVSFEEAGFPTFDNPLLLEPNSSRTFGINLGAQNLMRDSATVTVWGQDKKIVAIGSAGTYSFLEGERDVDNDEIWEQAAKSRF